MSMKLDRASAEKMAALEEGCSVTAGVLDLGIFEKKVEERKPVQDHRDSHLGIFSKLVELKRRDAGLSREALAERAQIEAVDLFVIETNLDQAPEPRVVSRLSKALALPPGKMMQLVGHLQVVDGNLTSAAQRFAANSGSMQALSLDERKALSEFVDALAKD